MKICIMQPAFIPPASYFRLFAAADLFVIYDDVQFNRRWYTHRQRILNRNSFRDWVTLPVLVCSQKTLIKDLQWQPNAHKRWLERLCFLKIYNPYRVPRKNDKYLRMMSEKGKTPEYMNKDIQDFLESEFIDSPTAHIVSVLKKLCAWIEIPFSTCRSSDLNIPLDIHGQDRIIAICKKLGATEYINSPGGKDIYDAEAFAKENIKLTFLSEWVGKDDSVIERLTREAPEDIKRDIYEQI